MWFDPEAGLCIWRGRKADAEGRGSTELSGHLDALDVPYSVRLEALTVRGRRQTGFTVVVGWENLEALTRWVPSFQEQIDGVRAEVDALALKGAEEARLAPVPEEFHGADPEAIINLFAAGEISREQVVDELARWPYAPSDELDGPLDDILVEVPGSFDVVVRAARTGLLPGDVYDEILDRYDDGAQASG